MKKILLILSLQVCAFLSVYAQPDETNIDSLWDMSLEQLMNLEVSGVSRYSQNISNVPNSIQVISHQQINDRGYQDLSDVLKDVAGFDIVSNAGQFGEFYSLRGVEGNDRFLILINGHKINPASGTHISIGNSISIKYAKRIEVIYGPASAVYGADAYSGIINIIFDEPDDEHSFHATGNFNYGSMNTIDGSLETSIKVNRNLSFYLMARMYQSDGPNFIDGDQTFYNYGLINTYPSPLVNKFEQPTDDHTIFFKAQYRNFSVNYFRKQFDEGNALGFIPEIYIYNKENKWKNSTDVVWINYKKNFKKAGEFNFDLTYKNHTQDNNTLYYKWNIPSVFDANETYKQYMTGNDNTIHATITYNQAFSDKFQFIAGVDNEYSTSIPPYANDEILGNSDKYEGENAKIIDEQLTITENRTAGFGQFEYSPFKFTKFTIGARYDYSTRYQGVFNPRLGLVLMPFESTRIKILFGRAFQAPSLFFQYEQWGAPTVANISMTEIQKTDPSWVLENQIVSSHEISVNQNITENINLSATAYFNSMTNLIERSFFAEYPTDSVYNKYFDTYTSGLRNENIGSQEIIGIDAILNTKISKNIFVYSYYSYTNANSIQKDGSEVALPRISMHKVWAGFTAQNLFRHVTFSTRFKWVSNMYNMNTDIFPNNIQPGYFNLDANIALNNLSQYFRIYANFENVLNQYVEHGGLYEQSGVYTAVIPQNGFTFKVGIEFFLSK
ncbi:MAG: TonB-dependent receptor [Bacteroidales bacterium]|nr:TonB-dependent receptor [Bacteroidales bacterium]